MNVDEIMKKYGKKIEEQINTDGNASTNESFSRDYLQFKKEMAPEMSRYEKWCKSLGSFIKIKLAEKDRAKIQKYLDVAHLDVSSSEVVSLAFVAALLVFFVGFLLSIAIYLILGNFSILLIVLVLIASFFLFYYFYSMPARLANKWRLKASSQMVPCILYVVVYMRHTSNLERAIRFAAQHLSPPLSFDFKKIFWDVETGKFSTIKESLDNYLETWRGYSLEFMESFHLIESSLYEPSDDRRIATLERALQVILDGVYEKMLKYSREIRSPLTNLYMLGIILPTLGLALLPLASTLLNSDTPVFQWYHVVVLFDLIIPFLVFYMTSEILLKRPGGHGESSILELNPLYPKYKSKKPYYIAFLFCFPLLLIGLLPFIFQFTPLPGWLGLQKDYTFAELGLNFLVKLKLFDFQVTDNNKIVGPFGPVAVLLSLFVPLAIALFFSMSYSMKTKELIKTREQSKELEKEFTSSLFQLGNRLGDGMPAEMAFAKVAESSRGTATEDFFKIVNVNLHQAGMSLDESLFNERRGALVYYPSSLIRMSMKILVESTKKGLQIAAVSLMSISQYIKNIDKINERLRDLLAEIVSDMKSNMTFLAPLLAGIVVGLAVMISVILSVLSVILTESGAGSLNSQIGFNAADLVNGLFNVEHMISPYFMQVAIGIYIIEIIFILTGTLVTVDAGEDKLKQMYDTASNLKFGAILYLITAFLAISILGALAATVLNNAFR